MAENSPSFGSPVLADHRENAPAGWPEVQDGVAGSTGLSVLLVNGHQPPAIVVSNNNSICRAFQSSPKHVKLCDPFCGNAHRKAMEAGTTVEYKCHAGLHCVVTPSEMEGRAKLAVIGGRAFVRSDDYQSLISRFRTGDLQALASDELFANIIFADRQRIKDFPAVVEKAARKFRPIILPKVIEKGATVVPLPVPGAGVVKQQSDETLRLEIERLRTELEHRSRFADSLQH